MCYSAALKYNPEANNVLFYRANVYHRLHNWQRCIQDCDQCLDEEPHQFEVLLLKAFALMKLGELQKVADVFNRVLHLQQDCKEVAWVSSTAISRCTSSKDE